MDTDSPGAQPPIEVFAVPLLLFGLAVLALGLFASDRLLMRTVARPRAWHSPRALRVLYVSGGALFALLGVSALLFG